MTDIAPDSNQDSGKITTSSRKKGHVERSFIDRQEEKWALIKRNDKHNTNLAVFVHGFGGSYLTTWGDVPNILQKYSDKDPLFGEWDYLFIGFETDKLQTYLDITEIVVTQLKNAFSGQGAYEGGYSKFSLFGHSLGTLGIRQLLCAWKLVPTEVYQAIGSTTLFGCPLSGSGWAYLYLPFGTPDILEALKPCCPQLRMLKEWVESAYSKAPWPLTRLVVGAEDGIVATRLDYFVRWDGDQKQKTYSLNHRNLVNPKTAKWGESEIFVEIGLGLK